jgi:hypothetical protein
MRQALPARPKYTDERLNAEIWIENVCRNIVGVRQHFHSNLDAKFKVKSNVHLQHKGLKYNYLYYSRR